jgi:hypothetical protein
MPGLSIPDDYPLSDLIGQEVTQICVGLGDAQVRMHQLLPDVVPPKWTAGASIDICAGFALALPNKAVEVVGAAEYATRGGALTSLLGDVVSSIERLEGNWLAISFASGAVLTLRTDEAGYESYHLSVNGEMVDVTRA